MSYYHLINDREPSQANSGPFCQHALASPMLNKDLI